MNLTGTIRAMAEKRDDPPFDVGKQDFAGAAKELKTYAMKDGGIDKKDMLAVASQLASQAKKKSASVGARMMRNIAGLDTDVRDKIKEIMKKHGLSESVMEAWLAEAPEDNEPASPDEGSMALQQLEFIEYAAEEIGDHIKAGGKFPEWMQNKLSTVNDNMQSLHSQIDHDEIEDDEEEMDEAVNMDKVQNTYKSIMKGGRRGPPEESEVGDFIPKGMTKADIAALIKMLAKQGYDPKFLTKDLAPLAEAKRDPSKSGGSGYDLYHKDFSSAMQHAYKYAKDKLGITIDPKEIDDKVASGPRKPSSGKTNTYRLKGDKGTVQIQVANLDNKKYELNMYKEEVELDEAYKTPAEAKAYEDGKKAVAKGVSYDDNPNKKGTKEYTAWSKGHNDARARKIARKEEAEMTEEVNLDELFESAFEEKKLSLEDTLKSIWEGKSIAKEDNTNDKSDDGDGLDKVQPKALKKKFKDRKDKDIDNDGDVDDSDEYMHKKRQAVSKAIEKDSDKAEAEQEKEVSDKEDEPKKDVGKSGKQTKVEVNPKLDEEKGEEMTSAELEKRDEIMKSLEKKKDEFVKKYGDRAKEVMARTAIKMAKKHA